MLTRPKIGDTVWFYCPWIKPDVISGVVEKIYGDGALVFYGTDPAAPVHPAERKDRLMLISELYPTKHQALEAHAEILHDKWIDLEQQANDARIAWVAALDKAQKGDSC